MQNLIQSLISLLLLLFFVNQLLLLHQPYEEQGCIDSRMQHRKVRLSDIFSLIECSVEILKFWSNFSSSIARSEAVFYREVTIYNIFKSQELIDESFNHNKLNLNMAIGAFLLIKFKDFFFHHNMLKKIFQKTHQSIMIAQILQTIAFFDTENLID